MNNFSFKDRNQYLNELKNTNFDVLIIGGGITGAGIAVQSAAAGLKTALIEMQDFAEGTSSRSTKLVHGGIRYLKTFDVDVVNDTVKERANIQRIAPHVPRAAKMLMPIYDDKDATFTPLSAEMAMSIYDKLSGTNPDNPYAHKLLREKDAKEYLPDINHKNLKALGIYLDYKNNDSRLTIENIKQSVTDGAVAISHVKANEIKSSEKLKSVIATDLINNQKLTIKSKIVVNATGPWHDSVAKLINEKHKQRIRGTKGIHLVVDGKKLSVPETIYFDSGHHDGRMIFVIPHNGKTYFGTTDTDYHGDYSNPQVEKEDVNYLLESINYHFPNYRLTLNDIESSWAGIRPLIGSGDYNGNTQKRNINDWELQELGQKISKYFSNNINKKELTKYLQSLISPAKSASQVSRGFEINIKNGIINVSGGKLTDYRLMGEDVMKLISQYLKDEFDQKVKLIDSTNYQISGGHFNPNNVDGELKKYTTNLEKVGLNSSEALKIANLFGSNSDIIADYVKNGTVIPGLDLAETGVLNYSLDNEMVTSPTDFLLRRTNYLLFNPKKTEEIQEPIIDEMARQFHWNDKTKNKMRENYYKVKNETQLKKLKEDKNNV